MQQKMISIVPDDLDLRDSYRLTTSVVIPRPIAWVSTMSPEGIPNLAPFSFYNAVSGRPPTVMFSLSPRQGEPKDTLRNVRETGEFVLNLVDEALAEAMNLTSADLPYGVSEFEKVELAAAPSLDVRPPRVAAAPVAMEARVTQIIPVEGTANIMILGRVVRFHVREGLLRPDWSVDPEALKPLGRLGRDDYTTLGRMISMPRPDM